MFVFEGSTSRTLGSNKNKPRGPVDHVCSYCSVLLSPSSSDRIEAGSVCSAIISVSEYTGFPWPTKKGV